jgi:hypothetical protein
MLGLSAAKWGYVTRGVSGRAGLSIGEVVDAAELGVFVVAQVVSVGVHEFLEDPHGRRARLYPGDLVVGAYGNRYATDFYEGYLPERDAPVHLLTAGGVIGTVASAHTGRAGPTVLEVLGPLCDSADTAVRTDDVAVAGVSASLPRCGTVVVVGSAMNAGKTTATAAIVRGFSRAGVRVGAGKVTGSGSGKDRWEYVDAGAHAVADFLDFGMASTFGYPVQRLLATMCAIRDRLVFLGADVVVLEIADGLLQAETRALCAVLPGFADAVVLAVGDALGAVAGMGVLTELNVVVGAISGLVTASPLASREAAAATGLAVISPAELAGGAALGLLSARTLSARTLAGGPVSGAGAVSEVRVSGRRGRTDALADVGGRAR